MKPLEDNPFMMLGLPTSASQAEIQDRISRLKIESDLNPGGDTLSVDEITAIREVVRNEDDLANAKLFWIHSPSELIDQSRIRGDSSYRDEIYADLKRQAGRPPSKEQAMAEHDLAVVALYQYITAPESEDAAFVLDLWARVASSTDYWEGQDDPVLAAHADRLRSQVGAAVLEPVAEQAAAFADSSQIDSAAVTVAAIRRSGFSETEIETAVEKARKPTTDRLRSSMAMLGVMIKDVPSAQTANKGAITEAIAAADDYLLTSVLAAMQQVATVDPLWTSPDVGDDIALLERELAVAAFNGARAFGLSTVLESHAISIAGSDHTRERLAAERAESLSAFHQRGMASALNRDDVELALAHVELALPLIEDEREAEEVRSERNLLRQGHGLVAARTVEAHKSAIEATFATEHQLRHQIVMAAAGLADAPNRASRSGHMDLFEPSPQPLSVSNAPASYAMPSDAKASRWWRPFIAIAVIVPLLAGATVLFSGPNNNDASGGSSAAPAQSAVDPPAEQAKPKKNKKKPSQTKPSPNSGNQSGGKYFCSPSVNERLKRMERELDRVELEYANGLPSDVMTYYNDLRQKHNGILSEECTPL